MRDFGQPRDVGVDVEAHAGLGVTETTGELNRLYPTLMPEGGATMTQGVRREAGEPHRVAHLVSPSDFHGHTIGERLQEEGWRFDSTAYPLAFGPFTGETYVKTFRVHVASLKSQGFRHTRADLFHDQNGQPIHVCDTFEDGDDLRRVGWDWFTGYHAWKLDAPVAGDVRHIGEVEYQAELADEEAYRSGLVSGVQLPDPFDDLAYRDLVDGNVAERVEQDLGAEPVAVNRSVRYAPAAGDPIIVHMSEESVADDGSLEFALWIFRGGKAVRYEVTAEDGFAFGPEGSTVLYLRVPAATAVADVEPSAVPGVTRADVEGRQ